MENEQETIIDSTNNEEVAEVVEETVDNQEEPEKPEREEETPEAKHARLKRQLAQHEKKFGFKEEGDKPEPKKKKEAELSFKDTLAIAKADVHEDDLDEVIEFAKFKGMSVADALKSEKLKAMISVNKEHRTSADVANTASARRGSAKISDDVLLDKAAKGEMPDSDADIQRLLKLKQAQSMGK